MTNKQAEQFDVVVIGAGVSGIGAAIRLQQQGVRNFVVLEKAASLGGTWRDNTYPGCACDVPSALYSYSFEQKPDWSRLFAGQAEILDYVQDTAKKYQVERFIRFGESLEESQWNEAGNCWDIRTSQGRYQARVVISCTGYLHEPILPKLPGLKDFPGKAFHSSQWDHNADLQGKRVAVIGTGASAIQFVPEIQRQVAELKVYQRTPQWILPKLDVGMGEVSSGVLRFPGVKQLLRAVLYSGLETFGVGFRHPVLLKQVERLARLHIRSVIKDTVLREKVTPDYTLGCKRMLLSNNYYPALAQPNVEVFATGVKEVRGNVIVADDGSEREVDIIILGTGFHVTDQPIAHRVRGTSGKTLAETWNGSPEAYRGTTIHGFPNLFLVLGPNLAIGHNSAFIVIESQISYAMSALRVMSSKKLRRVEVKQPVQQQYNESVQQALQGTVWNTGGCSSYYIDANGKNSTGFPWSTLTMQRLLSEFDVKSYDTVSAQQEVSHGVTA